VLRRLFAIDPRSLAAFRIALAALLIADLVQRWSYLSADLSDAGYFPREFAGWVTPLLTLHRWSGEPGYVLALGWLALAAALALAFGWRTRAATCVCFLLTGSMQERNLLLSDGGDLILRALLLWSLFLPLGACASLDARRASRAGAAPVFSFASAALLFQLVFVFAGAGIAKSHAVWRETGSAVQMALSQDYWRGALGPALLAHPELLRALSFATIGFEVFGPLLMFSPRATSALRVVGIGGFFGLMAGLGLGIELNLFPFCASATALPFVPASAWERIGWRLPLPTRAPEARVSRSEKISSAIAAALFGLALLAFVDSAGLLRMWWAPGALYQLTGTSQKWTMYGPAPAPVDLVFHVRGTREGAGEEAVLSVPGSAPTPELQRFHERYRFKSYLEKNVASLARLEPRTQTYLRWLCASLAANAPAGVAPYRELSLDFEPHRIALESRGPGSLRDPQPIRVRRIASQRCEAPVSE
jgi:hypothetical protein